MGVCHFKFKDKDGTEITIIGKPAMQAYLADGGLEHLFPGKVFPWMTANDINDNGVKNEYSRDSGDNKGILEEGASKALPRDGEQELTQSGSKRNSRNGVKRDEVTDDGRDDRTGSLGESGSDIYTDTSRQKLADETPRDIAKEDFYIQDDELGYGTDGEKIAANMAAIRLVKQLEAENRKPTQDEKIVLSNFVGWGALKEVFDESLTKGQKAKAREELKVLFKVIPGKESESSEYHWARQGALAQHFTSPEVVKGIYSILEHIGFKGGNVLEPTLGVGNFIGLMPLGMKDSSLWSGAEIDPTAGKIASYLYPEATIKAGVGFQDAKFQYNQYDLAIGNPPFGDERITDKSPANKAINRFKIHNYIIAKSAKHLKPGGVMAFVVTNRFLDTKDAEARSYLAESFNMLAAIRLPNDAFKKNAGTEVTTDIIFLQKMIPGQDKGNQNWLNTEGELINPDGERIRLNQYFAENPELMLGKPSMQGKMYGNKEQFTLIPNDGKSIAEQLSGIIENKLGAIKGILESQHDAMLDAQSNKLELNRDDVAIGGYVLEGDKVYIRNDDDENGNSKFELLTPATKWTEKTALGLKRYDRIKKILGLRTKAYDLINAERADKSNIEELRAALNKDYDSFVGEYGYLNSSENSRLMSGDIKIEYGLEKNFKSAISAAKAKKTGFSASSESAEKADILKKRVFFPYRNILSAANSRDGYSISLSEKGKVDLDYISTLTGLSKDEVVKELSSGEKPLVYQDPKTMEYTQEDEYLSGNVKRKLNDATGVRGFEKNVAALKDVQPKDVTHEDIFADLGQNWISKSVYEQFLSELGVNSPYVSINTTTGSVAVTRNAGTVPSAIGTAFTNSDYSIPELFNLIANKKPIVAYDVTRDSKTVNQERTKELQAIAKRMSALFRDWVFSDTLRTDDLTKLYNETQNTTIERKITGEHLRTVGANPSISLRDTQKIAAWRMIQQKSVLLDHVVGAGKTITIITGIMERRRLGLSKKPMIVVPNHLVSQWSKDFMNLYPGANILAASEKDFSKANRRRLFARIATGNYDAIIVGHSSFKFIPVEKEVEQQFIRDELSHLNNALSLAKDNADKRSVRAITNRIAKRTERLIALNNSPSDDVASFQQMGIDYLTVDECFPYDTPVLTNKGWIPIGHIVENKLSALVLTCNLSTHELEWKPIARWIPVSRNKTIVKVIHSNGYFTCTSDHKIWTKNGYIKAGELSERDSVQVLPTNFLQNSKEYQEMRGLQYNYKGLPSMRKEIFIQNVGDGQRPEEDVLREYMRSNLEGRATWSFREIQQKIGWDTRSVPDREKISIDIRKDEEKQPDEESANFRKNEDVSKGKDISSSRWKLENNSSTTNIERYTRSGDGICNNYRSFSEGTVQEPSESLQGGHSISNAQIGNRSRWEQSQNEEMEVFGQEENGSIEFSRVESVEILERGDSGEPTENSGYYQTVYDIEVEDNHNFFAAGVLVSNCHEFKNLEYSTGMRQVPGMGSPAGSQRAFDLYMKVRLLLDHGDGGVTFATGTPISNSLVEMYSLMRYLNKEGLKDRGIESFDAWAKNYASIDPVIEYMATGKLKERNIMGSFNNVPEMMQLFNEFSDSVTMDDLKNIYSEQIKRENKEKGTNNRTEFPVPKVKDGGRILVKADPSNEQLEYIDYLIERSLNVEQDMKSRDFDPKIDNTLWVYGDAKKAALDLRILDPSAADNPDSKVNKAVSNIYSLYKKSDKDKGTQLVFIDLSTPSKTAKKDAQDLISDIKNKLKFSSNSNEERTLDSIDSYDEKWRYLKAKLDQKLDSEDISGDEAEALEQYISSIEQDSAVFKTADTGFSVYDDVKKKLVSKGIPDNEIQFIHDYKTAIQKKDLFDLVNSGKIRVLLGSTPKMGAGTNVQERLVGLHHIDASMHNRPSDIEQREGRIIRQGNKLFMNDPDNFEVEIYAYSTERTFDAVSWQTLAKKAKMLESFRTGARKVEEDQGDAKGYMEFMAETTGNPVFREKVKLEGEISELEAIERRLSAQLSSAQRIIKNADSDRELMQNDIDKVKSVIDAIGDAETLEIDGEKFKNDYEKELIKQEADYRKERIDYATRMEAYTIAREEYVKLEKGKKGKAPSKPKEPEFPYINSARMKESSEAARFASKLSDKIQSMSPGNVGYFKIGNQKFEIDITKGFGDKSARNVEISDSKGIIDINQYDIDLSDYNYLYKVFTKFSPHEYQNVLSGKINRKLAHQNQLETAKEFVNGNRFEKADELSAKKKRFAEVKSIVDKFEADEADRREELDNKYIKLDTNRFPTGKPRPKNRPEYTPVADEKAENVPGYGIMRPFTKGDKADDSVLVDGYGWMIPVNKNDNIKFSQSRPKLPGFTIAQVIDMLPAKVKKLFASGKLVIVQSVQDLPAWLFNKGAAQQESLSSATAKRIANAQALYFPEGDQIFLVADSLNKKNLLAVLSHELLHRSFQTDQKLKAATDKFDTDLQIRFNLALRGKGTKIELEAAKRVITANTPVQHQLEEFKAYIITRYALDPQSITGKLKRIIADFIAAIRVALVRAGLDFGMVRSLSPSDLFAMSGYGANVDGIAQGNGGVMASFAGELADTTDQYQLTNAKQLIESGIDPEKVRQDTGWFKGVDGKWRFEIDDSDARLKIKNFSEYRDSAINLTEKQNNEYEKLYAKDLTHYLSEKEKIKLKNYEEIKSEYRKKQNDYFKLKDILSHDALYSAYPYLLGLNVKVNKALSKGEGIYNNDYKTISLPDGTIDLKDIMHEIQHSIQSHEDFSRGGSPSSEGDISKYLSLSGEVESRNVESRLALTSSQRKSTPPSTTQDVPDNDVIVVFNGEEMRSAPTPANATANIGEFNPDNPDIRFSMRDSVDEVVNSDSFQNVVSRFDEFTDSAKNNIYALATQRQLIELGKKGLTVMPQYLKERIAMNKTIETLMQHSDAITKDWEQLVEHSVLPLKDSAKKSANKAMQVKLADTMHFATVYGQDPRSPYTGNADNEEAKANYKYVKALYNQLNDKAKDVFNRAANDHANHLKKAIAALKHNIEATNASKIAKDTMIQSLDKNLRESSIYFPLSRFGDYWLYFEKDGKMYFNMFETENALKRFIKNNQDVKIVSKGVKFNSSNEKNIIPSDFLNDITNLTDQLSNISERDQIQDAIYQLYLKSLPDISARKHFIHRNKTPGFHEDALRGFASKAFHDAKLIGRLEHRDKLENYLKDMDSAIKAAQNEDTRASMAHDLKLLHHLQDDLPVPEDIQEEVYIKHEDYVAREPDPVKQRELIDRDVKSLENVLAMSDNIGDDHIKYARILNELQLSHNAMMNPQTSSLASFLNSVGFVNFLGFSASAALINGLQVPVVSFPYMAAKYDAGKVSSFLGKAYNQFINNKDNEGNFSMVGGLTGNDLKAFNTLHDRGILTRTRSMDLIGLGEEGVNHGSVRRKLMYASAYMFNRAEVMNREVTGMAAFRLAMAEHGNFDAAIDYADEVIAVTHGDYSGDNRARFMRGNAGRVMFQFKQYSQFMSYNWGKSTLDAIGVTKKRLKGEALTKEDKQAVRLLFGMIAMQGSAAGLMGLPIGGFMIAAQMLANAIDDDDDPIDFEAELKAFIYDNFTDALNINDAIARGPLTAWTGIDFNSRLNQSDMWLREPERELEGQYGTSYLLESLGGPIVGIAQNLFDAKKLIHDDHIMRGIEKMLPKAIKDPITALRYNTDGGARNMREDLIEEIGIAESIAKAGGFGPAGLSLKYDENFIKQRIQGEYKRRRTHLLDLATRAKRDNDPEEFDKVWADIEKWNSINPDMRITRPQIIKSWKLRMKSSKKMEDGFLSDKRLKDKTDQYSFSD